MSFRLLGTSCLSGILMVLVPCAAAETAAVQAIPDRAPTATQNQETPTAVGLIQSVIFAVRPFGPDGSHYDVAVSPQEATLVRLWLDSGAVANGTYAIMDGGTPENPSPHYMREMKRYGILSSEAQKPIDVYATDETYWRSFWYQGPTGRRSVWPDEAP